MKPTILICLFISIMSVKAQAMNYYIDQIGGSLDVSERLNKL